MCGARLASPICFLPYKIGDTCLNKDLCFSHPASGLSPFVSTFVSYPHGFWFRSALPIALTFTLGDCACMHGDCACMPLCYGIQIKPIQIIQHLLPAHVANASVTVAWCKNHYL